jgi:uncharacterized protein YlbG (UPF0298 family)
MGNTIETVVEQSSQIEDLYNRPSLENEKHSLVIHCNYLSNANMLQKIINIANRCKKFKLTIKYTNRTKLDLLVKKANKLTNNQIFRIPNIYFDYYNKNLYDDWDDFINVNVNFTTNLTK